MAFIKKKDNQTGVIMKTEIETSDKNIPESTEDNLSEETPIEPKTEWIWVTGYKGVTGDLKGYNDFQYEIGKTYEIDGDIDECKKGYHLCRRFKDVFFYYGITEKETVRYFKVSALVPKDKWEMLPDKDSDTIKIIYDNLYWSNSVTRFDKIAAKAIRLEEEIDINTIISLYLKIYPDLFISRYPDEAKEFYSNHLFGRKFHKDFLTEILHKKYGYTKEIGQYIINQNLCDAAIAFGSVPELSIKEKLQFIFKNITN